MEHAQVTYSLGICVDACHDRQHLMWCPVPKLRQRREGCPHLQEELYVALVRHAGVLWDVGQVAIQA